MNYYLFVTGCQQNIYDSNRITHLLKKMGYVLGTQKEADVIIIIACSVRQKAVDRVWGKLRYWKRINPKAKIILTGCVLDQDKKSILEKVDCIIDSKKIEEELPKKLSCHVGGQAAISRQFSADLEIRNWTLEIQDKNCVFVPIMFGCNNFCSYCAVPYTRGREVSRPKDEILMEIRELVKNGATHITLLGQNVNSYQPSALSCQPCHPESHWDEGSTDSSATPQNDNTKSMELKAASCKLKASCPSAFVALLQDIEKVDGVEKISFLTSHPKDMSNELIEWINNSPKFSGELHLPMQSGDDEILRTMNRNYTAKHYLNIIKKLKKKNVAHLSTDIIVGFPGETKEQFENTYKICNKIGFNKAYISQFSPRAGTPAAKMSDSVSPTEKKRRWEKLNNLINKKSC